MKQIFALLLCLSFALFAKEYYSSDYSACAKFLEKIGMTGKDGILEQAKGKAISEAIKALKMNYENVKNIDKISNELEKATTSAIDFEDAKVKELIANCFLDNYDVDNMRKIVDSKDNSFYTEAIWTEIFMNEETQRKIFSAIGKVINERLMELNLEKTIINYLNK